MSISSVLPPSRLYEPGFALPRPKKHFTPPQPVYFAAHPEEHEGPSRQAELFYLQKQISSQTPMVVVLEDGERIDGRIEWYDRNSIKISGRTRTLVYKSAIKYMYKLGDQG